MLSLEVVYDPDARQDLLDIVSWIIGEGTHDATAWGYVDRIEARCNRIGLAPRGGSPRGELRAGLRSVLFEHSATIFYQVEDDRVVILRILRRGRDVQAQFTR